MTIVDLGILGALAAVKYMAFRVLDNLNWRRVRCFFNVEKFRWPRR